MIADACETLGLSYATLNPYLKPDGTLRKKMS